MMINSTSFDNEKDDPCDDWSKHTIKKFLTKDMLMAGTYLGEYPSRVEGALLDIRRT